MMPKLQRYLLPYRKGYCFQQAHYRPDIYGNDIGHCVWVPFNKGYGTRWLLVMDNRDIHGSFDTKEAAMTSLDKLLVEKGYILIDQEDAKKYMILLD